jgi:hypothetical protein
MFVPTKPPPPLEATPPPCYHQGSNMRPEKSTLHGVTAHPVYTLNYNNFFQMLGFFVLAEHCQILIEQQNEGGLVFDP